MSTKEEKSEYQEDPKREISRLENNPLRTFMEALKGKINDPQAHGTPSG